MRFSSRNEGLKCFGGQTGNIDIDVCQAPPSPSVSSDLTYHSRPWIWGLMCNERHVIGCHLTQEMRV